MSRTTHNIGIIIYDIRSVGGIENVTYALVRALTERGNKVIIFNVRPLDEPIAWGHLQDNKSLSNCHIVPVVANKRILRSFFSSPGYFIYCLLRKLALLFAPPPPHLQKEPELFYELSPLIREYKIDSIIDSHWSLYAYPWLRKPLRLRHAVKIAHGSYRVLAHYHYDAIKKYLPRVYNKLVLLSDAEIDKWSLLHPNIRVIPNFVAPPIKLCDIESKNIITVCRFENQKALYKLLLIFWAICREETNMPAPENIYSLFDGYNLDNYNVLPFIEKACAYRRKDTIDLSALRQWRLNMIGDGKQCALLTALVSYLGMEEYVIFHGKKTHKEVLHSLQASSIFALTSFWEGLPIAMLEALSYGLALISFNVATGPRDIIKDNGFLIPDDDYSLYTDKLITLMTEDALRRKCGAASADFARRFHTDSVLDEWEALLAE